MVYLKPLVLRIVLVGLISVLFYQNISAQEKLPDKGAVLKNYNSIRRPITFNAGQFGEEVKFSALDKNAAFFFTSRGPTILLSRETQTSRNRRKALKASDHISNENAANIEKEHFAVKLNIIGANEDPDMTGEERLPWNNNYFIGNDPAKWRKNVPNYSKIRLKSIYDNIDLVYYFEKKSLKYDFIVYRIIFLSISFVGGAIFTCVNRSSKAFEKE